LFCLSGPCPVCLRGADTHRTAHGEVGGPRIDRFRYTLCTETLPPARHFSFHSPVTAFKVRSILHKVFGGGADARRAPRELGEGPHPGDGSAAPVAVAPGFNRRSTRALSFCLSVTEQSRPVVPKLRPAGRIRPTSTFGPAP